MLLGLISILLFHTPVAQRVEAAVSKTVYVRVRLSPGVPNNTHRGVAQLGLELPLWKRKVVGSNPTIPTLERRPELRISLLCNG